MGLPLRSRPKTFVYYTIYKFTYFREGGFKYFIQNDISVEKCRHLRKSKMSLKTKNQFLLFAVFDQIRFGPVVKLKKKKSSFYWPVHLNGFFVC